MSLLETTPANPYRQLRIPITSFPSVFRSEPLAASRPLNTSATPFSAQPDSPQLTYARASPPPTIAGSYGPPPTQALAKVCSSSSSTYATVGGVDGYKEISIAPNKAPPTARYVLLNASDLRLDEGLPKVDLATMNALHDRINRQKICNNYHLHDYCPNGKGCTFQHGERLNTRELMALRHKVRNLCCPQRSDCRNVECQLGHVCPRNASCTNEQCFFGELHNIDTTPAVKQYEDGKILILNERVLR